MAFHDVRRVPNPAAPDQPRRGLARISPGWWAIICLVYILSPIDLMPELILGPFIGLADDAGIAAFGVYNLFLWFGQRRRARAGE